MMGRRFTTVVACLALVGCAPPNEYQPPPPPTVTVAKPIMRTVTNYLEETGTTAAVERVEIRARVRGFLEQVDFTDGQTVEAGQQLYRIQQREFQAVVAAARADVESKNVELNRAKIELDRQEKLFRENATAETRVVQARSEYNAALAAVDASRAALDRAELNLQYTDVTTPIAGRVERTLIKLGNLVGDNGATHLTTVVSYDPIHAYFNISERNLLRAMVKSEDKPRERREIHEIPAFLQRAVDEGFPFEGNLDYADLGVQQSTGTFTLRAIFPNPDLTIVPGLFVRIRIPIGTIENAVLIPERSVGADQAGRFVMIVVEENLAERRNVELGTKFEEMVVITDGLSGAETVVIDGIQRARPGTRVTPQETELRPTSDDLESVEGTIEGPAGADGS